MERVDPEHYRGNGITCSMALESMQSGADMSHQALWWWGCAFKYVWRWPRKGGINDIDKAIDCLQRLRAERLRAYDRDGIEILEGDTVYLTTSLGNEPYSVAGFASDDTGVRTVKCRNSRGYDWNFFARSLSHEKPNGEE